MNKKIEDNPSLKKLSDDIKNFEALSQFVPFFEKFGIKNNEVSEAFKQFPDLAQKANEFIKIPDKFNSHFANEGWIAYESMNHDIMKKAVELAENNKKNEAEQLLVNYYDESRLKWVLKLMYAIPEFQPRYELANKALEDYLSKRYYSSILVLLTVIDGFVNDFEPIGFFAEGVDLTAWDSIAAHSSGLHELSKLFQAPRKKTSTEKINIPYRNGILHGRDLGYNNKIVAAKVWAALFAIRDWALAIKAGKKEPEPPEPEPNLIESFKQLLDTQKESERIKKWKARELKICTDIPDFGNPEEYEKDSPEKCLTEFLHYWMNKNYGYMAKLFSNLVKETLKKRAGKIRDKLKNRELKNYTFLNIFDQAPAITKIRAKLDLISDNIKKDDIFEFILIYEGSDGYGLARGNPKGSWKIQDFTLYL